VVVFNIGNYGRYTEVHSLKIPFVYPGLRAE